MKNKTQPLNITNFIFIPILVLMFSLSLNANESVLAEAKEAFESDQLEVAETIIKKALSSNPNDVEALFLAGRIAGKKAQHANIFSKLGYARDTKKYFTKALEINPNHQPSIIGLIRFHQQAPVMAGGDKQSVYEFMDKLRSVDARAAFDFEAPMLLDKNELETALLRYNAGLKDTKSNVNIDQFRFDSAMVFSAYGHHQMALDAMLDIEPDNKGFKDSSMRLYQLGKLAAESKSKLQLGLQSMKQYSHLPEEEQTIPKDWVEFRLAQLSFLINKQAKDRELLLKIQATTTEESLKQKITSFLNNN